MNGRLLVLDDEPGIIDAYRIILNPPPMRLTLTSSRGGAAAAKAVAPTPAIQFDPTYCTSGEEALDHIQFALKEGRPFVGGFFDVKLGAGMDGLECIRRAKSLDPNILCVTVTAYQDRNIDEISKLFGEFYADRWDFLSKPFTNNEILQKARNLVFSWDRRKREKEYLDQIKQQQELLIRQERLAAMGTLARGIGHEFGNILLRIMGKAEIARQRKDATEMEDALKVIGSAAERAGHIVRNLQGLVKMESKREPTDIHVPINDSLQLIEHELKKANVACLQAFDEKLAPLAMNRTEVGQVFLNLFINAVHAMEPKGGELRIRTSKDGAGISVEVEDTGSGIDPEHLPHLFEPLFTTKGERGTGIGLNVSRKIVENHRGKITVKSTVGMGTTFKVWLPAGNPEKKSA